MTRARVSRAVPGSLRGTGIPRDAVRGGVHHKWNVQYELDVRLPTQQSSTFETSSHCRRLERSPRQHNTVV
eukprot:5272553-Pyramimonas_sp.AAC.1